VGGKRGPDAERYVKHPDKQNFVNVVLKRKENLGFKMKMMRLGNHILRT